MEPTQRKAEGLIESIVLLTLIIALAYGAVVQAGTSLSSGPTFFESVSLKR